jgi:prolyl-tRNA synthetase
MLWSKFFIPTIKETPIGTEAVSHQLSLRAGIVHMLSAGVYCYLPLGLRVLKRVEDIIRQEMNNAGAHELFLSCLQPIELWQKTGRDKTLAEVMIRFKDKKGKEMCLGPTHEEVITEVTRSYVQSYRQLPVTLYQIQTKFRDELRTRFGIVRACEFIMKDAYSFDRDKEGLKKSYKLMYDAYNNIFKRCGLNTVIVEADSGAMGGDLSHEFLIMAPIGEDFVAQCSSCGFAQGAKEDFQEGAKCPQCSQATMQKKVAIELGHIFQLGTKYTDALEGLYLDEDGKRKPMVMGCYGIGVSRMIAAIIEANSDANGIIWPKEVAPFDVEILPLQGNDPESMKLARDYYDELRKEGFEVLLDDRDESAGRKFNDADLIGIPWKIIIGKRKLAEGAVELKSRKTGEVKVVPKDQVVSVIKEILVKS